MKRYFIASVVMSSAAVIGCSDPAPAECTAVVSASGEDTEVVQTALIEARAGDVVCLQKGHYRFTDELSLTVPDVKVRGTTEDPTDVILDWADQVSGANGMGVTGDGFTLEYVSIRNVRGDGVRVTGAEDLVFRHLVFSWDAGSHPDNGAYAIFPVQSRNILVEDIEVTGASDAGVYIGQSENVVVRNNRLHGNVDGISIENSSDVEVYGNEVWDNTGGIVVFNLPNLPVQDGRRVLVRDNVFRDNNRENFGDPGAIIYIVPKGTGMAILAADDVEVRGNVFRDHGSTGVAIASYNTLPFEEDDPDYDAYPETIYIHGNTFENNGYDPDGLLLVPGNPELEDIVWDGDVDETKDHSDGTLAICIRDNGEATYRYLDAPNDFENQHTDMSQHDCEHPLQEPVKL